MDKAIATTLRSSFANQGEICLCGSRIFVHESVYEEFLQRFVKDTEKIVVGDPKDTKTGMGALVSKQHMEKIQYYVDLAQEEGGKIESGGQRLIRTVNGSRDGYFFAPTIITGYI
jgi:aminomuconate-semialdehyde/2-hydroxymuconate-6-semialdehyde dehydrogenase